jgi:hypothetical protein
MAIIWPGILLVPKGVHLTLFSALSKSVISGSPGASGRVWLLPVWRKQWERLEDRYLVAEIFLMANSTGQFCLKEILFMVPSDSFSKLYYLV